MTQKIILIDSNNIAYRAFYALPDTIVTSGGVMTNAVLGFTNMFLKIVEDHRPDRVVCAFDSRGPTFRHKMFEEYKMHRKKMPDGLMDQLPLIKEVMQAFNISCIEMEGMEADDILATIAADASGKGDHALIVTGDKDMLQMVSDRIQVLSSRRSITDTVIYGPEAVKEKMGVAPGSVRDLLALMGDSSDNIPGVPGIGPKTAVKLIDEFGTLEAVYKDLDKVKSVKLREILEKNKDLALKSKELTTLKKDLKIDRDLIDRSFRDIDQAKVKDVFGRLEFGSLLKRLPRYAGLMDMGGSVEEASQLELSVPELERFRQGIFSGTGSNQVFLVPAGKGTREILVYPGEDTAYLVDDTVLEEKSSLNALRTIMEERDVSKTGINLKQVIKSFLGYGIDTAGRLLDLEIMYLALNPVRPSADIGEMSSRLLGVRLDDIGLPGTEEGEDVQDPSGQAQMSFDLGPADSREEIDKAAYEKVLKEAALMGRLGEKLVKKLEEEGLTRLYEEIEEPLIKVLAEIENKGVAIDTDYLDRLIKEYDAGIDGLTRDIHEICGSEFNINSSQQLANILYDKLGLPALKKTKTGFSTDAATLKAIRESSPVIDKILDYREKTKLKNTYVDVLPRLIDPDDGRIHTSYNQMGTTTGRISSSDPNLQNIPVRTSYGKQIRKAFIPGQGYDMLMASDYSQIELRVLAHLSGDKSLIDSFNREEDIHDRTASEIFGIDYDDVPDDLRRKAKAINFGIIYGMTDFGLASRLSISNEEAGEYIRKYFERYPMVDKYLKELVEIAVKNGYSTTMFGRKRYIRELGSSNARIRSLGERYAVNTPIQGSAADIMKLSTIKLHDRLAAAGVDSNIILHVHDEIVLELKQEDAGMVEEIVRASMEDVVELKVRLRVDIKTGKNWYI